MVNTVGYKQYAPILPIHKRPSSGYLFNAQKDVSYANTQLLYITKGKGTVLFPMASPERNIEKGS